MKRCRSVTDAPPRTEYERMDGTFDLLLSFCLGLGLAAACGFRVFVPLLVMSLASRAGHLSLGSSFDWISGDAALAALAVATALEIGAYFVPWLDNLLDTAAIPVAAVAGTLATAAVITDASPLLSWTLAVIGGGGVATGVQGLTTLARGTSSMTTAGFGNPVIAAGELGGSLGLSLLSLVMPVLAALLAVSLLLAVTLQMIRRPQRDKALSTSVSRAQAGEE